MINTEIVKGALMCAVWIILLISDCFFAGESNKR